MKRIVLSTISKIETMYGNKVGLIVKLISGSSVRHVSQKTMRPSAKSEPTNVSSLFAPCLSVIKSVKPNYLISLKSVRTLRIDLFSFSNQVVNGVPERYSSIQDLATKVSFQDFVE